jgi:hypothetical protein
MKLKNTICNKIIAVLSFSTLLITSCNNNGKNVESLVSNDSSPNKVLKIHDEIFSIPSPIQFTTLIKKSGAKYDKEILNPSNRYSEYSNNFSKALNLGIYSADLGYVIVYDQTQDALGYLNSIKNLADPLGLERIFDENLVKRFSKNIGKQDSLQVIVADAFLCGDAYLKDNNRTNASGLILAGSWIESLHIAAKMYETNQNEFLKYRIAEQKLSLQSLTKALTQSNVDINLTDKLKELSTIYDSIEYKYTYVKPTTDEENKTTTINSKTEIKITTKQLDVISQKIEEIRNEIVGKK